MVKRLHMIFITTKMIKKILIVIIMALFRSDVINKEFIEKVLRKNEVNLFYMRILIFFLHQSS